MRPDSARKQLRGLFRAKRIHVPLEQLLHRQLDLAKRLTTDIREKEGLILVAPFLPIVESLLPALETFQPNGLRAYLVAQKAWGKAQEEELAAESQTRVEAAIERYLATPPRAPETMFDHLYATLPKAYASQRDELKGAAHA